MVIDGCQFAEGAFPERCEWLESARLDAIVFTVHGGGFRQAALEMGRIHELSSRDGSRLAVVRTVDDLDRAAGSSKIGIVLAFQDPAPVEDRLELLRAFYELGLRVLQLTYNKANGIGTGCAESRDSGLTDFGKDVVRTMNRLGMVIDLSHTSRRTALEAIELSSDPVVFSHACAHALSPNPRNRTDAEIRALAAKGGVMGLTPWGPLCWKQNGNEPPGLDDYLDHVAHVAGIVGCDAIGFGTDQTVDGSADEAGIRHQGTLYPEVVGEFDRRVGTSPRIRYTHGFAGIHELPNVVEGLKTRGFGEADIHKFLGGNFRRVFERVWRRNDA